MIKTERKYMSYRFMLIGIGLFSVSFSDFIDTSAANKIDANKIQVPLDGLVSKRLDWRKNGRSKKKSFQV